MKRAGKAPPAPMSFVEFCERVVGVTFEPGQKVFWSVAADGVEPGDLTGAERELALQMFGDIDEVPEHSRRHVAVVKGADIGWSFFGGLRLLHRALVADVSDAAAGEVRPALCVAPDLRLGRIPIRAALGAADSVPAIKRLIESRGADGFVLIRENGKRTSVETLPATAGGRALRGRRYVEVFFDEGAFFRDANYAVNDVDCRRAVITRCLGTFWNGSTPWLESADVWQTYEKNFGAPTVALAARLPTLVVRTDPRVVALVESERERDPEGAATEYDCQPALGGAGVFFGAELLLPALRSDIESRDEMPDEPDAIVRIGGDIGLVRDSSAAVAIHKLGAVCTVADCLELRPKKGSPLKLSEVVHRLCEFAARHGQREIHVDHHSLQEASEHVPDGFDLVPVAGGQGAIFDRHARVRTELRAGNIAVPRAFSRLTTQLALVVAKAQSGGGTSISMPRRGGAHGDLAAAFVLALSAAVEGQSGQRMLDAIRNLNASDASRRGRLFESDHGDAHPWYNRIDPTQPSSLRNRQPSTIDRTLGRRGSGWGGF